MPTETNTKSEMEHKKLSNLNTPTGSTKLSDLKITRNNFKVWFADQGLVDDGTLPMRILLQCFQQGYQDARIEYTPKTPKPLNIASFTNTVMAVYKERDQAISERDELLRELSNAVEVNSKFKNLLESAKDLLRSCKDDS